MEISKKAKEDLKSALNIEEDLEISVNNSSSLDSLKEDYFELEKRFGLPSFDLMNRDFQIEKIQGEDTDFLLREVRKFVGDKFTSYLRFLETLIQPSGSQTFVFMMLKSLDSNDMNKIKGMYERMARKEVELLELDLDYNEEKESEFVKTTYNLWNSIKKDLIFIFERTKLNWDRNVSDVKKNNYYG